MIVNAINLNYFKKRKKNIFCWQREKLHGFYYWFDNSHDNSGRKNGVMRLILWLTPFEAVSEEKTSVRHAALQLRKFWHVWQHCSYLCRPRRWSCLQCRNRRQWRRRWSKHLRSRCDEGQTSCQSRAASHWWLIHSCMSREKERNFTWRCQSDDIITGLRNWQTNYLNDTTSMDLNDENAFWNNGWSWRKGKWMTNENEI